MAEVSRYAVIGHPISHSKSPEIHRRFAEQTGQTMEYGAIDIAPADLGAELKQFFAAGGCGLNVTVPHKEAVAMMLDSLSGAAEIAAAVNTIAVGDTGELIGHNTDGIGLLADLTDNLGVAIAGKRILVLGAGGATRGILPALIEAGPEAIHIANRTASKATDLATRMKASELVTGSGFDELTASHIDLLINATSAGLSDNVPALPTCVPVAGAVCYDLSYTDGDTPFIRWARQQGCTQVHQGLGMLVEQAAAAFEIWRGVRPDTAPVLAALG